MTYGRYAKDVMLKGKLWKPEMKKPELYANSIKSGVKEKICKGVDWT